MHGLPHWPVSHMSAAWLSLGAASIVASLYPESERPLFNDKMNEARIASMR